MKSHDQRRGDSKACAGVGAGTQSRLLWVWAAACCLLWMVGFLRQRGVGTPDAPGSNTPSPPAATVEPSDSARHRLLARLPQHRGALDPAPSPEQVVSNKVVQFAHQRREVLDAMARKLKREVSEDIKRFFDAAEVGNWEELDRLYKVLVELKNTTGPENPIGLWGPILDTYGAAEQAHAWPAQKLLDYGEAVLGSLRPGMIYVGGTDEGRWIPELLNDTSEGERHIIVTQNAFADKTYLDYVAALYGERMNTLTSEDSQEAFREYLGDAQKRLEHDQNFPDEPRQVRPFEEIHKTDNRVSVGGQVAVMSINEKLLDMLMQKNPDLSFALQESVPLRGTYRDSVPLGPILELGARDSQSAFTAERAGQSVDYWRGMAGQLAADPESATSPETLKSYSKLATAQANLFGDHNFSSEAEEAYRIATSIWPGNVEAVSGLSALLENNGHMDEARRLAEEFERKYPGKRQELERGQALFRFSTPAASPRR